MRASTLVAALALAGCGRVTSLDVTVLFDDGAHHPEQLAATITVGGSAVRMNTPITAPGRAIRSGDDFVVLVPDSFGGKELIVDLDAVENGVHTLHGEGRRTVDKGRQASLTITL